MRKQELPLVDVLVLHRKLVSIPSISGDEGIVADFIQSVLSSSFCRVERIGNSVLGFSGTGKRIVLNSHVDTVPPAGEWGSDPWTPTVVEGRVYGLGSNDAKASVAAMIGAVADGKVPEGIEVCLMLVEGEEVQGIGTQRCLSRLAELDWLPEAVVVGEPTELSSGIGQFGLAIFKLEAHGDACHAAHGSALQKRNPIWELARDLSVLQHLDIGDCTIQPTMLEGAGAKNQVAAVASAVLDVRLAPGWTADRVKDVLESAVGKPITVISDRLTAYEFPRLSDFAECCPEPKFLSRTMSDQVFFQGIPAIKCGPGCTDRSHTPNEYVLETEVLDGVATYKEILRKFSEARL